jgi:hypothetical protein
MKKLLPSEIHGYAGHPLRPVQPLEKPTDKVFRVTFDDGSDAEYTAEELGPKLSIDARFAEDIELWNGMQYVSCLKGVHSKARRQHNDRP